MNIQPILRIINDDVSIIDTLVDNGEMFKNFDTHKTTTFLVNEDLHVVFYFNDSSCDNRFVMYIIENFTENADCMSLMLHTIDEQIKQNCYVHVMKKAKNSLLDMAHMAATFRALFGKSSTHETNELYY